ncbi:DUF4395 domain-containing protein [Deinococcus cellulosilyticus]|uniref:DUF4395 domain-containing protein n=1 Tax=Deinococcus cellulosilyticus (strain DSM 18568 / NBRC 106333 / KACC 11606 / 5516J-15) TaxID=1223518 RepID=A0A511MY00_DEIC1|nr:DUF4395 domain-containing protein [Deinococcus cellulosilyticus]GEM45439.1 hypothetical protein DC3_10740 [Deinococcus cellulosilyticus NBRC 106333 = KACC 11606]
MDHRPSLEHFQQSNMIALTLIAMVLQVPGLLFCLAFTILVGAVQPAYSPFRWLYSKLTGLQIEIPQSFEASQFAQLLGGAFLLASSLALFSQSLILAAVLAGIVVLLALINLTTGFCLGCQIFYHLKLRSFRQSKQH